MGERKRPNGHMLLKDVAAGLYDKEYPDLPMVRKLGFDERHTLFESTIIPPATTSVSPRLGEPMVCGPLTPEYVMVAAKRPPPRPVSIEEFEADMRKIRKRGA